MTLTPRGSIGNINLGLNDDDDDDDDDDGDDDDDDDDHDHDNLTKQHIEFNDLQINLEIFLVPYFSYDHNF